LPKKLGIDDGCSLLLVAAPDDYRRWLVPPPTGVRLASRPGPDVDVVHVFVTRRAALARHLATLRSKLSPTAAVWVSWPKKAAKLETDVTEDTIREVALPLGFVDVKVCAVTEVWSGLKLVVRKELR
jgi:hypothetical protein